MQPNLKIKLHTSLRDLPMHKYLTAKKALAFARFWLQLEQYDHTLEVYAKHTKSTYNVKNTVAGYYKRVSKTKSVIVVSPSLSADGLAAVIFHEASHMKQYLTGELYEKQGITFYKDKPISNPKTYSDYFELPYEVAARLLEHEMYCDFKGYNIITKTILKYIKILFKAI